jgi:hypothetical protein
MEFSSFYIVCVTRHENNKTCIIYEASVFLTTSARAKSIELESKNTGNFLPINTGNLLNEITRAQGAR